MIELFRIMGTIGVNGTSEANHAIDSTTKHAQNASNKIVGAFKKIGGAIVAYFAIDKIKDFGVAIVQTAADVQAETAQFEAAFKDLSGSATEMFNRVSEATGVFATRLQVTGTKAFAQLKGSGLDANEALKQTEVFLNLATDAAAYYDISLEDAEARIRSFMRGNVEAGDAIGLFTSESQRNSYALEMYGKKWIDLAESQKQMLMLNVAKDIYDQSGATGQAARESDGLANVTGNLKEVWRQFLGVIGQPVLEAVIPIMETLTEKVKSMKNWVDNNKEALDKIKTAIEGVVGFISDLVNGIINAITWLVQHEKVLKAVGIALGVLIALWATNSIGTFLINIGGLTGALKTLLIAVNSLTVAKIKDKIETLYLMGLYAKDAIVKGASTVATWGQAAATKAATAAQWLLNAAMNANPIGLIIAAIVALIAIFVVLWQKCEWFRNFWIGMWNGIKTAFSAVVGWIKENWQAMLLFLINPLAGVFKYCYDHFEGFRNFVDNVVNSVKKAFTDAWEHIKNTFSKIGSFFSGIWGSIKGTFTKLGTSIGNAIGGAVKSGINGIIGMIEKRINGAISIINGAIGIINKIPKVNIKKISALKMPRLETGGVLEKGQVGLLEGNGAEAVVPLERNKKWISKVAEDMDSVQGGSDVVYTLQRLIDMLATYFPQMIDLMDKDVVLDDGTLVGKIAPKMNRQLAELQTANERGR